MFLLGLHGPAQSGKDTAFAAIKSTAAEAGFRAARRGFADKLKLSAMLLFKPDATLEEAVAWADDFKFNGHILALTAREELHPEVEGSPSEVWHEPDFEITGRQLLQRYGTEAHRDVFGQNFWVDALLPYHESHYDEDDPRGRPRWWDNFTDNAVDPLPHIAVITDVRFPNEAERIHYLGGQVWRIDRHDLKRGDGHASEQNLDDSLIDHVLINGYGVDEYRKHVAEQTKDKIIPELRKD